MAYEVAFAKEAWPNVSMALMTSVKLGLRPEIPAELDDTLSNLMDLIPYSFVPLILFLVPYTLDFLPYYLSVANGAGGVGIFELLIFRCFV